MAGNRWKNLDFNPPRPAPETAASAPGSVAETSPCAGIDEPLEAAGLPDGSNGAVCQAEQLSPRLLEARGAYCLRSYQTAVDLLEAILKSVPCLAGGQRLLGQALARLNRGAEARARLFEAVRQSKSDWLSRASLASLLLGSPELLSNPTSTADGSASALLTEALGHAPRASQSAIHELLSAAYWQEAQEELRRARCREAARLFGSASTRFARAALESAGARRELARRQSAAVVGQAVALIAAGSPEAAQRLFSGSPLPTSARDDPLCRFAAGVYELCEQLPQLTPEEQQPIVESLREVVLGTRLEVGFYDGRAGVSLCWCTGPA